MVSAASSAERGGFALCGTSERRRWGDFQTGGFPVRGGQWPVFQVVEQQRSRPVAHGVSEIVDA